MLPAARRIFYSYLAKCTPHSRWYGLRSRLLRCAGYDVDISARICSSAKLVGNCKIRIGADTFIGHESLITGGASTINIEENCDISTRVLIISGTHEITPYGERVAGPGKSLDITIRRGCWIGANATILGGVEIGENAVVAAGAVVCKNIPARTVVAGVPARQVRFYKSE